MRKIHYSILKRINRLVRSEYSLVSRYGARFLLNKNNWIDSRLLNFQPYEHKNLRFIRQELDKNSYDRFLDIGANIGFFSTLVPQKNAIKKIMSFEPLLRNYIQLSSHILLNKLETRVDTYHFALGDVAGKSILHFNDKSTGIGTLVPEANVRDIKDYDRTNEIECRVFDDEFDIKNETLFIKMDVEQYEYQALQGMKNLLSHNRVMLLIEINDPESPVFSFLKGRGFDTAETDSEDYVFKNF